MRSAFITDYHRPNEVEFEHLTSCSGCNHDFEDKDVKYSKMTGEYLCIGGEGSCWNEAKERHNEQNRIWGFAPSAFE
jgi:hypothetical protein